jgi:hypothetical protein
VLNSFGRHRADWFDRYVWGGIVHFRPLGEFSGTVNREADEQVPQRRLRRHERENPRHRPSLFPRPNRRRPRLPPLVAVSFVLLALVAMGGVV